MLKRTGFANKRIGAFYAPPSCWRSATQQGRKHYSLILLVIPQSVLESQDMKPEFMRNPRGSLWHRWDLHLHAPGTLLSDQFKGNWDAYLQRIKNSSPVVHALGVTDYFCIQTYRNVREYFKKGQLGEVAFIFPNVEMRLDIKTEKKSPINIHLLFSPEDENHETEIERILGQLKFEFRERSYACMRLEIERFAHIIFASTPSQIEFWLGKKEGHDRDFMERTYGGLKPCLHGSDAHREEKVGVPPLDRMCWLKGDRYHLQWDNEHTA